MRSFINSCILWLLVANYACFRCQRNHHAPVNISIASDHARRNYDTDFKVFMKKIFTAMPAVRNITVSQQGPGVGYRPYWYGYNFFRGIPPLPKQNIGQKSDHEVFDYGLDAALETSLWGRDKKNVLMNAMLGTGEAGAYAGAAESKEEANQTWFPNLGPTGVLGPDANTYSQSVLNDLLKKTIECDSCRDKSNAIQCVQYEKDFFETTECGLTVMNCLKGEAYIKSRAYTGSRDPFPLVNYLIVRDGWLRVSVKGTYNAMIYLMSASKNASKPRYCLVFRDPKEDNYPHYFYIDERSIKIDPKSKPISWDSWTESSFNWDTETGWILWSQPRTEDWRKEDYFEYVNPNPFRILYVQPWSLNYESEWIFHDLPYDLVKMNNGPCQLEPPKYQFPEDTQEIADRIAHDEQGFNERMDDLKARGYKWWYWNEREGSDNEY